MLPENTHRLSEDLHSKSRRPREQPSQPPSALPGFFYPDNTRLIPCCLRGRCPSIPVAAGVDASHLPKTVTSLDIRRDVMRRTPEARMYRLVAKKRTWWRSCFGSILSKGPAIRTHSVPTLDSRAAERKRPLDEGVQISADTPCVVDVLLSPSSHGERLLRSEVASCSQERLSR